MKIDSCQLHENAYVDYKDIAEFAADLPNWQAGKWTFSEARRGDGKTFRVQYMRSGQLHSVTTAHVRDGFFFTDLWEDKL